MKTFYQIPPQAKTFFWVVLCLLNILVVFSACYSSAKSVQGYTLAVTVFVIILMTYAHEKRWRNVFAWVLIAYGFYSILVHGYLGYLAIADRALYRQMGIAYPVMVFGATSTPYIFGAISAVTTALWGLFIWKKKGSVTRLLKIVFAASLIFLLMLTIVGP